MYLLSTFTAPRPCRSRLTETLGWVGAQGMAAVSNCTLCWKSNPRRGIKEVYEFMSLVHIVHCLTWVCEQMNLIKDINMYACSRVYWRQVPGSIKAAHVRAWNIKIRLVTIRRCQEVLNKTDDWITGFSLMLHLVTNRLWDTHRCQCRPCGGSEDEIRSDF